MRKPGECIGRLAHSGYGAARAAIAIHDCLQFEGPQRVFVCEEGRVYALPRATPISETWLASRREWWVADYTLDAYLDSARAKDLRAQITEDLRYRLRELLAMQA